MTARRAATFLATLGALVMSSGIALMVVATPANAAPGDKVVVCKYVSTPGGELDHIVVVADDTLPDAFNGNFPFIWTDAQGQSESGSIAIRYADSGPPPEQAKDIATSECPSEDPGPELCPEGTDNAGQEIPEGQTAEEFCNEDETPVLCPEGTDNAGQEIPDGQTAEVFCDNPDVIVDPPGETPTVIVDPPTTKTPTVTPTVVSAGLGEVSSDLRGEQGLALIVAGMVLMVAAGGLGLRGRASRI